MTAEPDATAEVPCVNADEWRWTYDHDLNWIAIQGVVASGRAGVHVSAKVYGQHGTVYIGHDTGYTEVGGVFDLTITDVAPIDDLRVVFTCAQEED